MAEERRTIPPNPPRWQPNQDPASIRVPGLDTSASVLDQIEQMEQLITIKLQNIDENFSKIHHLLANKLLPAVKRYAVGTEPVREAAKFWTSFYEQAAQIHIPTYDDYSTVNENSSEHGLVEEDAPEADTHDLSNAQNTSPQSQSHEESLTSTESSFMPGHAAFSSTPATARATRINDTFGSEGPSWSASMESPLVRLDRQLQQFSREDEGDAGSSFQQIPSLRLDEPTPNPKQEHSVRSEKGKEKETSQPLLRNVLRHNLYSMSDMSKTDTNTTNISPLKYRGKPKTPIAKKFNPYLPQNSDPSDWSGIVDLRNPSIRTPQRYASSSRRGPKTPANESDDDESFDGLPPGMSPPVLMSPARPPRSSAELGLLGQTPTREATARITQDLVRDIQHRSGQVRKLYGYANSGIDSSTSTIPTPPSLSRYRHREMDTSESIVIDSSLESMMRRVGLNPPSSVGTTGSTPGLRLRSKAAIAISSPEPTTPVQSQPLLDIDSDSDSLDEINNTAHPSAAFLMASSQGHQDSDDSFGSSNHSGDSLTEEDVNLGLAPVHPFAGVVDDHGFEDDDSYDDDIYDGNPIGGAQEEETLFGVQPGRQVHGQARLRGAGGHLGEGLKMLGEDLLQDTIGFGAHIAKSGRIEESPTPASWTAGGSRS